MCVKQILVCLKILIMMDSLILWTIARIYQILYKKIVIRLKVMALAMPVSVKVISIALWIRTLTVAMHLHLKLTLEEALSCTHALPGIPATEISYVTGTWTELTHLLSNQILEEIA